MSMHPFRPADRAVPPVPEPGPALRSVAPRADPGKPVPRITWKSAAFLLAWAAGGSAGLHFVNAEPWNRASAYGAALVVYVSAFVLLARQHRRGVAPYLRRAGYRVALAGTFAGVVWAVVARGSVWEGVVYGLSVAGVHYAWIRLGMLWRGASPNEAPGLSPE